MRDEIKTERLALRQLTLDDAPAFSKLAGDKDIARMTGSFPHPFPLLSAEFKVMHLLAQKRRSLAYPYAITQGGGELMGIADLFRRSPNAALEIGYWLGKPFWGHGYVTEASQALIAEARKSLAITTLLGGVFADNPASQRIMEKLGFTRLDNTEMYFSMGRLEKAHSLNYRLDFPAPQEKTKRAIPLRQTQKMVMSG